jgi:hypothetical protein
MEWEVIRHLLLGMGREVMIQDFMVLVTMRCHLGIQLQWRHTITRGDHTVITAIGHPFMSRCHFSQHSLLLLRFMPGCRCSKHSPLHHLGHKFPCQIFMLFTVDKKMCQQATPSIMLSAMRTLQLAA